VESYAVGYMDECGMTVVMQPDSSSLLTTCSKTRMTSLTKILLVYFVTNIVFALSLSSHLQIEIKCVGCLSVSCRF